jgi:hypothetical protein
VLAQQNPAALKRIIAHSYDYSLKSLITQAQDVNQPAAPFFFACFAKQARL